VFLVPVGVYDVERPISTIESIFDERKKDAVFFVGATEEGTNMTLLAELGTGKINGGRFGTHKILQLRGDLRSKT
jgi:hypothetical protein